VISDLYLNPVFRQEEIEKERGVIIEEINMYEDLPQRRVAEIFNTLMYGDQPAGWDIAGEKEVVRKMNREDFVNYRAKHYVAEATMVVVAGSFNEEKLVADIKKKFANIVTDKKQGKLAVEESQKGPQIKIQNKKSDQTHLILGVRAFSAQDKRRTTLKVFADILGGGMSSRLFQRVREELGAAYYVRAGVDLMTDHGSLDVSVGAEHGKVHKVIEVILEEMRKFKDEPVSKKELEKSKEHLIGGFVLGLETSDDLALFTGSQEILRREILEPEEIIKMVCIKIKCPNCSCVFYHTPLQKDWSRQFAECPSCEQRLASTTAELKKFQIPKD